MNKPQIAIWLFEYPLEYKEISPFENECLINLSLERGYQYKISRGYAREVLSFIHSRNSLDIPLNSPPNQPPHLPKDFGYFSISHCKNALLLGWSKYRIGVDIEKKDRAFKADRLSKRFFSKEEVLFLKNYSYTDLRDKVLDLWVIKEAAIKFHSGNIASDLSQWNYDQNSLTVSHRTSGLKVRSFKSNFIDWKIAIAYDLSIRNANPIICFQENKFKYIDP